MTYNNMAANAFMDLRNAVNYAETVTNSLVDEHHTMDELYDYRMMYNAMAANSNPDISYKSKRHADGKPCFDGTWFIVVMELPTGQISNHYKLEHWDLFHIPELYEPDYYDDHTPKIALERGLEWCRKGFSPLPWFDTSEYRGCKRDV